jgi:hypothetical protein
MSARAFAPAVAGVVALALLTGACGGRVARTAEQTYMGAQHNWAFRREHPDADRLFNAFDYGHAALYETLIRRPGASAAAVDGPLFDDVTQRVLKHPPAVPLAEQAIGPSYATMVPEVVAMFEWAHALHRQLYDVLADPRVWPADRDARVAELMRYYASRPDLAFSAKPKSMDLMEGQPYSLAFRRQDPKYNGLLWSYHWMQMALYDALLDANDAAARRANVSATVARFRAIVDGPAAGFPATMPMSAAVAPRFSERYPEAAIVFDNMHALHDVVADILTSPDIPRDRKRRAILTAAARYRDSTTAIMTVQEWREMAQQMGDGLPR